MRKNIHFEEAFEIFKRKNWIFWKQEREPDILLSQLVFVQKLREAREFPIVQGCHEIVRSFLWCNVL